MNNIVIIGTGLAGYTVAREFRKLDTETPLIMLTADEGCFYSKPMLSNALANGKAPHQLASVSAAQMATQLTATIRTHVQVTAINTRERYVNIGDEKIPYGKLVLALGADPIKSNLSGTAADKVISVNNLMDYTYFRAAIADAKRVAIIGGGLIGCEFANDLSTAGYAVDVIHPGELPMMQLLPREAGHALLHSLSVLGVQWHCGKKVLAVDHHDEAGYRLSLSDGGCVQADVVLSAIGLQPHTQLASSAGLRVNKGIVVDKVLMTSATDIYALGDCAEVNGLVLPFVLPIMQAARALAKTLSGQATAVNYPAMPVVIKTPAYPIVVSSSPAASGCVWQTQVSEEGIRAFYYDENNTMHGFALTGKALAEKTSLLQGLPAWL